MKNMKTFFSIVAILTFSTFAFAKGDAEKCKPEKPVAEKPAKPAPEKPAKPITEKPEKPVKPGKPGGGAADKIAKK